MKIKSSKFILPIAITAIVLVMILIFGINNILKSPKKEAEGFDGIPDTSAPQVNYIGCYKDDGNRQMNGADLYSEYGVTLDSCRKKAIDLGFDYYSIQDSKYTRYGYQAGVCAVSNNLNKSTSLGNSDRCIMDPSGNMVGVPWVNAIYSVSTAHNEAYNVENNTDYSGITIDGGNWNYNDCVKKCNDNPLCNGFITNPVQDTSNTYPYNGTYCWLKKSLDPSHALYNTANKVTFKKKEYYPNDDFKLLGCYENRTQNMYTRIGRMSSQECFRRAKVLSKFYSLVAFRDYNGWTDTADCWLGDYNNQVWKSDNKVSNRCYNDHSGKLMGVDWVNSVYVIP